MKALISFIRRASLYFFLFVLDIVCSLNRTEPSKFYKDVFLKEKLSWIEAVRRGYQEQKAAPTAKKSKSKPNQKRCRRTLCSVTLQKSLIITNYSDMFVWWESVPGVNSKRQSYFKCWPISFKHCATEDKITARILIAGCAKLASLQ